MSEAMDSICSSVQPSLCGSQAPAARCSDRSRFLGSSDIGSLIDHLVGKGEQEECLVQALAVQPASDAFVPLNMRSTKIAA